MQTSTHAIKFIERALEKARSASLVGRSLVLKRPILGGLFLGFILPASLAHAWDVDFSRRQSQMNTSSSAQQLQLDQSDSGLTADRTPASLDTTHEKTFLDKVFDTVLPMQDLVILNTEQGFVPSTLRVKEGSQYRIFVVNVNEKARNVSFVLDAFSEHHATFYGKIKSFVISPKKEGVYTYISPETSAQGRLVVYPAANQPGASGPAVPTSSADGVELRKPASE